MKHFRLFISIVFSYFLLSCSSGDFNGDDLENPLSPETRLAKIVKVDYKPAPGQFVNDMPAYEDGDTPASMNQKALDLLNRGSLVSLGAFGGEITITLAEPITHDPARNADFRVLGNSYITGTTENNVYGSSEPGMVWVMKDENGNGLPDDTWYRFVGDMQDKITYVRVTYTPVTQPSASKWVDWQSSDSTTGALTCNLAYHDHSYFPRWIYNDPQNASMSVSGYMVPANGFLEESSGLFRQICYRGFADCFPNSDIRSAFSLADAVDLNGNPANLDAINFIRITTAVLDSNGPLGETSTEVGGIELILKEN